MRIVLGVSGGIAAYKAILLLRLLKEAGHSVRVIPTAASLEFVGRATWEALSGQSAADGVFEDITEVAHVRIGQNADLMIVAPATADLLARAASGRADDLLTSTLLTAHCPILFAPAMHTEMWQHAATQANVATLRSRGVVVLDPASGRLTGADTGPGRLPEPDEIAAAALALVDPDSSGASAISAVTGLAADGGLSESGADPLGVQTPIPTGDLTGRTVVISAGGTIEPLDPVRFLGNRSSGRQGIALAQAAVARGAQVHLIAANVHVPIPDGVRVTHVESALELRAAMRTEVAESDVVVMTAAVADFRPAQVIDSKIKKAPGRNPDPIELIENPDILAELVRERARVGQVIVGFAAETGDDDGDVLTHGRAKARRKGADLLVINDVSQGRGFGAETNDVTIVDSRGEVRRSATGSKLEVANVVLDAVLQELGPSVQSPV